MGSQTMSKIRTGAAMLLVAITAFIASFGLAAPAMAQEIAPEHLALARKYIELTDKSDVYELAMVKIGIDTMKVILPQNPTLQKPISDAISKVLETYKGRKGELLDQFARVYALQFSMEELQKIVDFYQSPVGQKLATANATLNQDIKAVMKVFDNNARVEFLAQVRAELKAKGYNV